MLVASTSARRRVPFTFDETADNFFAMAGDPVQAPHLNIPSINAPVMPGRLVTTRTLTSTGPSAKQVTVTTTAPPGSTITVSPRTFALNPGASVTLTITITSTAPAGVQQFGSIRLTGNGLPAQHLPVAFVPTQGTVDLTQSCSPSTITVASQSTCTVQAVNNSFNPQTVDLDTISTNNLRMMSATGGATVIGPRQARLHGVVLSGAQPGVPSVAPGALFGYLPLSSFGIPFNPIGDEEVLNFNIDGATLDFAGQNWNRIGVDSNGYIVMGGGGVEDNNCCNIPTGPSAARPNNVLAPFWTDLDGTGAPGVAVGFLGDGSDEWLVVEFKVNVFGTNDLRTFQVWIGDDSAFDDDDTEDITYAYAAPQTDPAGQDFLVGAENFLGQGDMEAVLPTADLRVTSGAFTPGGSVSYTVNVRGDSVGAGTVRTEMTATGVPGVTIVSSPIQIVKKGGVPG